MNHLIKEKFLFGLGYQLCYFVTYPLVPDTTEISNVPSRALQRQSDRDYRLNWLHWWLRDLGDRHVLQNNKMCSYFTVQVSLYFKSSHQFKQQNATEEYSRLVNPIIYHVFSLCRDARLSRIIHTCFHTLIPH